MFGLDDVVLVGSHEQAHGVGLTFGVAFMLMGASVELFDPWLGSLKHWPGDGAAVPVMSA
jgi:hypothetical protein